ncbi:MAG: FtsW/RodA/SpoVE family cell cycle protein, partial [Acidimicrobiia bacterium]
LAVRRFAPRADGTLLGLATLLNGIGFVTIARLDPELARYQSLWTAVGVVAFIVTLRVVKRIRDLERYRYTFALIGIASLLLSAVPGIGREINGARLWVQIGPLNFQPGEAAKVTLVIFLAAYLVEKRELLSTPTWRVGPMMLPDPKHFAPLLLAWGSSILVMVREKDLGSSLLFFAVFLAMLYMATGRASYVGIGAALFTAGATVAYQIFGHVQDRVTTWLDPWPTAQDQGFQLVQALFAFGSGGLAGTGLGLGSPGSIPNASTDFVFAAIGEELGLIGTTAVLVVYLLLVGVGFRIALRAEQPFLKLLAAGLTTMLGVQTFIILGGVTRLIPLTGITMPFVSYGGSSLLANFVILALLLRISDEVARRAEAGELHLPPPRDEAR